MFRRNFIPPSSGYKCSPRVPRNVSKELLGFTSYKTVIFVLAYIFWCVSVGIFSCVESTVQNAIIIYFQILSSSLFVIFPFSISRPATSEVESFIISSLLRLSLRNGSCEIFSRENSLLTSWFPRMIYKYGSLQRGCANNHSHAKRKALSPITPFAQCLTVLQ
jgi:hypothetical protein